LMLGRCPLQVSLLTASRDCDPDKLLGDALEQIKNLNAGDGVLVLTDLYGSTPCNIANKLASEKQVEAVSGINLSMLIRVFNYPQLTLEQLSDKAISGGKDGIAKMGAKE
jgi:PTS system mannose-specific IIA component